MTNAAITQNATLSLILSHLGRIAEKYNGERLNKASGDSGVDLDHNLTALLLVNSSYYANDSTLFWNAISIILENFEEHRWVNATNPRLRDITTTATITTYILLMIFGSFGNLLMLSAVLRQPAIRTPQNAFIINLTVSDLLLCLFTMPLTLVEIVNNHWPLGDSVAVCKLVGGLQAVSVFVSTISIIVIALDRYQLIVYPTREGMMRTTGIVLIWLIGFLLASPIFVFRTLDHHVLDFHVGVQQFNKQNSREIIPASVDYCYEKWTIDHGRAIYSACTFGLQYAFPILIISFLHCKICKRLQLRHITIESRNTDSGNPRRIKEALRLRRRHNLLMAITLLFSITWLPLNIYNLVLDLHNPFNLPEDEEKMLIIYTVAHLIGMSSACLNPLLYGWSNEHFRKEFQFILKAPFRTLCKNALQSGTCSSIQLNRQHPASQTVGTDDLSLAADNLNKGKSEGHHYENAINMSDETGHNCIASAASRETGI